jgi:hypothetical protein
MGRLMHPTVDDPSQWSVRAMIETLENAVLTPEESATFASARSDLATREHLRLGTLKWLRATARRIRALNRKRRQSKIDQLAAPGAKAVPMSLMLSTEPQIIAGARAYDALAAQARMVRPIRRVRP